MILISRKFLGNLMKYHQNNACCKNSARFVLYPILTPFRPGWFHRDSSAIENRSKINLVWGKDFCRTNDIEGLSLVFFLIGKSRFHAQS